MKYTNFNKILNSILAFITLYLFLGIELFAYNLIDNFDNILINNNIQYHKVKLYSKDSLDWHKIINLDLDLESAEIKDYEYFITIINDYELTKIQELNLDYKILIEDYETKITNELNSNKVNFNNYLNSKRPNKKDNFLQKSEISSLNDNLEIPENFKFGTYFNYHTLDEIYTEFEKMRGLYPSFIFKEEIGRSIENRPIYIWRLNFTKSVPTQSRKVLFTSLHHAREPITSSTLIYSAWQIVESYYQNNIIDIPLRNALENSEIFFLPCLNPDGYMINMNSEKAGMWRKNARSIDGKVTGVDLNRNYGPKEFWNFNNPNGSSTDKNAETYRGESEFSEPETRAIRDLCNKYRFLNALNFHSYGNIMISPNLSIKSKLDRDLFEKYGIYNYKQNQYTFGMDSISVGYATRGSSDDWMYQNNDKNYQIFPHTPELDESFYQSDPEKLLNSIQKGSQIIINSIKSTNKFPIITKYNLEIQNNNSNIIELKMNINNLGFLQINNLKCEIKRNITNQIVNSKILDYGSITREINTDVVFEFDKYDLNDADTLIQILFYDGNELIKIEDLKLNLSDYTKYTLLDLETNDYNVIKSNFNFFINDTIVELSDINTNLSNWGLVQENGEKYITESKNGFYPKSFRSIMQTKNKLGINYNTTSNSDLKYELLLEAAWSVERKHDHFFIRFYDSLNKNKTYIKSDFSNKRLIKENELFSNYEEYILEGNFDSKQLVRFDLTENIKELYKKNQNLNRLKLEIGLVSDKSKSYDGIKLYNINLLEFKENKQLSVENLEYSNKNNKIITSEKVINLSNYLQINQEIKNIYVYDLIGNKINIFSQIGQNIYNFDFPNYGFYNIILDYNELGSAKTKSIQVIYNR
jgi:hypothetical protein